MKEMKKFFYMITVFLAAFYLPVELIPFRNPVFEAMALVRWYAREHVILCLVPAFFIAGAVSVFISQASVIRYFGSKANKFLAYGVASVSGTILAVCSCTVLPLFAGIYKRGAGLGPATAFLYSGPAINVLAIIITARVLGWRLGLARALGAIFFSIFIGLAMHLMFRKEERAHRKEGDIFSEHNGAKGSLTKNMLFFGTMLGFLVFANWTEPAPGVTGIWSLLYNTKWYIAGFFLLVTLFVAFKWFSEGELKKWVLASWGFAKQIMPLLLLGVVLAGLLLGRPGTEGLIPSRVIASFVGGNSLRANVFASVVGSFMYFATLTEVPILQGLIGAGMGQGPALALLLAGPALSLPNMLVIRSVMGTKRTLAYIALVVVMATLSGLFYGAVFVT